MRSAWTLLGEARVDLRRRNGPEEANRQLDGALDLVAGAGAEDAVLRSLFTDNLAFQGREQLGPLVAVVLEVLEDLTYTDELHADRAAILVGDARVDGLRVQFSDYLKLRDDGLISEMTVFFRPLPASTAAMRRFGDGLERSNAANAGSPARPRSTA